MLNNLLYLLILFMGFPAGLVISFFCKDEIRNWKSRLFLISIASLMFFIVLSFISFDYKIPVLMNLLFIIITDLTIAWKSH